MAEYSFKARLRHARKSESSWNSDNTVLLDGELALVDNGAYKIGDGVHAFKDLPWPVPGAHAHDDRYYTETEIDEMLAEKSDTGHEHDAADITVGVIEPDHGGTGQDTLNKAANALINELSVNTTTPTDADFYVAQYPNGGDTTKTYHRKPLSALWNYIKTKADGLYLKLTGGTVTGDITVEDVESNLSERKINIKTNDYDFGLHMGADGKKHGVYDFADDKWVLYGDEAHDWTFEGLASNATNAQHAVEADDSATINGHTVSSDVPANAKFTDTWDAMVGASAFANGTVGYVGAVPPRDGYNTKYLRADGTWAVPPDTDTTILTDMTGILPVSKGGTGADTEADARTNLGLGLAAVKDATTEILDGSPALINSGAVYAAIGGQAVTDEYNSDGTRGVTGRAINSALQTLDVESAGGQGKYIKEISETDGKIAAIADNLTMDAIAPVASVTYPPYTCAVNDDEEAVLFFATVVPTDTLNYYAPWSVKYRLTIMTAVDQCQGVYDCEVFVAGTSVQYKMFNSFYSADFFPIHNHCLFYPKAEQSARGGHLGVVIRDAYLPDSLPRTIRIDVLETKGCNVAPKNTITTHLELFNSQYFYYMEMNGTTPGLQETGDEDTGQYYLKSYSVKAASYISAGKIIVGTDTGYFPLIPGAIFDLRYPIMYAGSNIEAGESGSDNYVFNYSIDLSYTQEVNLDIHKPVYIKGSLLGHMFTAASTDPLTQTVPTTNDGYLYIHLGRAYNADYITLDVDHKMFKFTHGQFQEYVSDANLQGKFVVSLPVTGWTGAEPLLTQEVTIEDLTADTQLVFCGVDYDDNITYEQKVAAIRGINYLTEFESTNGKLVVYACRLPLVELKLVFCGMGFDYTAITDTDVIATNDEMAEMIDTVFGDTSTMNDETASLEYKFADINNSFEEVGTQIDNLSSSISSINTSLSKVGQIYSNTNVRAFAGATQTSVANIITLTLDPGKYILIGEIYIACSIARYFIQIGGGTIPSEQSAYDNVGYVAGNTVSYANLAQSATVGLSVWVKPESVAASSTCNVTTRLYAIRLQ